MSAADVLTERVVRGALETVLDPCSVAARRPMGLDQMGLIDAIEIGADGDVDVRMRLTSPACLMVGIFKEEIQNAVGAVPGVRHVDVSFDQGLDWTPDLIRSPSHEHADARA